MWVKKEVFLETTMSGTGMWVLVIGIFPDQENESELSKLHRVHNLVNEYSHCVNQYHDYFEDDDICIIL